MRHLWSAGLDIYFSIFLAKTGNTLNRENNQTAAASRMGQRFVYTSLTSEKTARWQPGTVSEFDFFARYTIITLIEMPR